MNLTTHWIDSHCHLDFFEDNLQLASVVARADLHKVRTIIVAAVAQSNWQKVASICNKYKFYGCYGLHPLYLSKHQPQHLQQLESFLIAHKAIAIGECGLDFAQCQNKSLQIKYFEAQLKIAQRLKLPVVIHARKSLDNILFILKKFPTLRFVVHSFSGSDQQLQKLLAQGGYIGIGASVTYPRAQRLRRQVAQLAANRYLLETDAPSQALHARRDVINEPYLIVEIAKEVAQLRKVPLKQIQIENYVNNNNFFAL